MNDVQLIEEALAGNRAAFGQLVDKYQCRLFSTLLHVVQSHEEAEDVAQETFVQAFVKLDTFQGRSAFFTWLYRIAFNLSVSRRRRRRPEVSVDQQQERTGFEPEDHGVGPHEQALRVEQVQQVRQAIERLNEQHRAILILREIEGCDYETIGEILSLPAGTVRSRLHRARLQLRDELKEFLAEHATE